MSCIVNTRLIVIKLRETMTSYESRTGEKMTYEMLSARTGLSRATIESLASRPAYNPRLSTIALLCEALDCTPGELLELDVPTVAGPRR